MLNNSASTDTRVSALCFPGLGFGEDFQKEPSEGQIAMLSLKHKIMAMQEGRTECWV